MSQLSPQISNGSPLMYKYCTDFGAYPAIPTHIKWVTPNILHRLWGLPSYLHKYQMGHP